MKTFASVGLLAGFMLLSQPADSAPAAAPAGQKAPTQKVVTQMEKNKQGMEGVVLQAYVKADIGTVWDIVTDSKKVKGLFPNILSIEFMKDESSPDKNVVSKLWTYKLSSPLGTKVLQVETMNDKETYTARWKRISGDLKDFQGKWVLTSPPEYPGYTHILYESFVEGGFFVPQFLTNRLNKKDTDSMIVELKKELETPAGKD